MRSVTKVFPVLLFTIVLLSSSAQTEKIYDNTFMGFKVAFPAKYEIKEYRSNDRQFSAELKCKEGTIEIRAGGASVMADKMPFDEYVKIAAMDQIQNYDELVSITPFVSESGIKGYKTYWKVLQTVSPEDFDEPEDLYPPLISGPIFYFPPKEKKFDGKQPLKTIMLSHYAPLDDKTNQLMIEDLEKIAKSFRYR